MALQLTGGMTLTGGLTLTREFSYAVAVAHGSAGPGIAAYPWSSASGFGTRNSDPTTPPETGATNSIDFTPTGDAVALGWASSPYLYAWAWSNGSGFGTKYAANKPKNPKYNKKKNNTTPNFANNALATKYRSVLTKLKIRFLIVFSYIGDPISTPVIILRACDSPHESSHAISYLFAK